MKSSGYWNMEDAFFGAILGVVLGDLWKNLSLEYIFIIIAFFVLFPMTLRRSEKQLGKTGILAAMLVGILWVVLLIIFLDSKSIVLLEEGGLRFMVVFLGWQVSRLTSILTSIG